MNKTIFLLFLIITSIFLYQHSTGISWDFSVYEMNAHYLLTGKGYFEIGRPPLASLLLFLGPQVYIIIVSIIMLFASISFSNKYKINPTLFYSLIMTPFIIVNGLSVGTELLSLALTLLIFAYRDSTLGGFFYGLSILTRYGNIINGILLINRDYKLMIKSLIISFLVLMPWLIFNWELMGHPLYSFADQYALNVVMREMRPFTILNLIIDLFIVGGVLVLFFIKGINFDRENLIFILFFVIQLLFYSRIPYKEVRYLFNIIIPLAFFSSRVIKNYWVVLLITALLLPFYWYNLVSPVPYQRVVGLVNNSCFILSNGWVYLNYLGVNSSPAPYYYLINDSLSKGNILVLFKWINDPSYVLNRSLINSLPIVYEDPSVYIIGSGCNPTHYFFHSYLSELNETLSRSNQSISVNDILKLII